MKRRLLSRPALVALTSIVACALAVSACETEDDDDVVATPMVDTAAEAEAIMALERQWSDAFVARDMDYVADIHAADAIQLPHNGEPVIGKEALSAAWQGMVDAGLSASWEPTAAFVSASGDMAWDYGTATLVTPDGATTPMKYLVVWKRENGEWKVAADMFNANVPPPTQ